MMNPLLGLQAAYNSKLHPAFQPQGAIADDTMLTVAPTASTSIDPLLGTGWGEWLDAAGASDPGGAHLRGGSLPLSGLQQAQPRSEQTKRERAAILMNKAQPAANFYPHAQNYPYNPNPEG